MPKPIQVSLDKKGTPPVTVDVCDLDMPRDVETIHWVRARNQDFDFVDVQVDESHAPPGTFPYKEVQCAMVTIRDRNTQATDCPYVITVISGGAMYQSQGLCKAKEQVLGGGSPTIHNR